jgi:type IV pilus assembly protein PilM
MASQVIGLDVGTNAVRAVELSFGRGRPLVRRMGQVALPVGAVVAGEVVDPPTVAAALRRLWREAGFSSRSVVVGVANQRVVARMAEFPSLPDEELRSSLPYQVQDLIPIPVDDAQLDFHVVERFERAGQEMVRVLLVAAHRDMVRSLLAALDGANLTASGIDLVPAALIRAVHDPGSWLSDESADGGQEVVVGVGAGVTNVVVHDNGVPQFVRTLPTGGLAVTEALASDFGVEQDVAEGIKRGGDGGLATAEAVRVDDVASLALTPLASEVAGSLDFHLAQIEGSQLRRAVLTGGGARLRSLRGLLEDQLGVPVVAADPFAQLQVGTTGLAPELVAASADIFTVAVGLALSGQPDDAAPRISLLPREIAVQREARRQRVLVGAGVGAFALVLVGLAYLRGTEVDNANASADRAEDRVAALQSEVAALQHIETLEADIASRTATVTASLEGDVSWPVLLQEVSTLLPNDVWLTSFSGSRGAPGTVQFAAKGFDQTSAARWLLRIGELDALDDLWLSSSTRESGGTRELVSFSSNANLSPAAQSDRLARYLGGQQ